MEQPLYIQLCADEGLLGDSMKGMLEKVTQNLDIGYELDVNSITESLKSGMTFKTFNMLVLNINTKLSHQYRNTITNFDFESITKH